MEEYSSKTYNVPKMSSEDFLIKSLSTDPKTTVVAIGPLTNLHLADLRSPGILNLAKQILIMGGAKLSFQPCSRSATTARFCFVFY